MFVYVLLVDFMFERGVGQMGLYIYAFCRRTLR